jgi:long-chain fatty acid transport protein
LGFELPDADAMIYSTGIRFRATGAIELGVSYMYHRTKARSISAAADANGSGVDGQFTEGGAHAVTLGIITTF